MKKAIVLVFLALQALPMQAHEGHDKAFGNKDAVVTTSQKVHISPEGQASIGLRAEPVRTEYSETFLETTGTVQAADDKIHYVISPVTGVLRTVGAQQGDTVRKGQTLATIYSTEVAKVLTDLLDQRAGIQADLSKLKMQGEREIQIQTKDTDHFALDLDREKQLLSEGITARKNYLDAQHAHDTAKVRLESTKKQQKQDLALLEKRRETVTAATKRQLVIMGLPTDQVEKAIGSAQVIAEIPIKAPADGTIFSRNVTMGESVDTTKQLFSIVKLSPIWVTLDVHQEKLNDIHLGQKARIKTPTGSNIVGTISSIGSVVDQTERTVHVRVVCDNKSGALRPDMFVTANILTGRASKQTVVVPAQAVIDDGGRNWVYVKYGDDFQPVAVVIGARIGDTVQVLDGLFEGDQVVVNGARQVRSQSMLSSKPAESGEHEHKHEQEPSTPGYQLLIFGIIGGILLGTVVTAITVRSARRSETPEKQKESSVS